MSLSIGEIEAEEHRNVIYILLPFPAEAVEDLAQAGQVADPYRCSGGYDTQRHQPVHAGHGVGIDRVGLSSVEGYAEVLLGRHDEANSPQIKVSSLPKL